MTPMVSSRFTLVVMLAVFSGCSHSGGALRKAFARAHSCDAREVSVTRVGREVFVVEGCGARETCSSSRGPCRPDVEALMLQARQSFMQLKACPESEIQVTPTSQGIAAAGCGTYAICPGAATNCFASTPPSCQDMARMRFDSCRQVALSTGADGRDPRFYPYSTAQVVTDVARNVTGSISEDRQATMCQSTYQIELSRCSQ
jgi:hypothetical protein